MKKILPLLISLLIITSCASVAQKRSLQDLSNNDFSVEIPEGWWKPKHIDKHLITKDGVFLQYVLIQQRPIDRPYRNTKKRLNRAMLPQEAAGVIIDEEEIAQRLQVGRVGLGNEQKTGQQTDIEKRRYSEQARFVESGHAVAINGVSLQEEDLPHEVAAVNEEKQDEALTGGQR